MKTPTPNNLFNTAPGLFSSELRTLFMAAEVNTAKYDAQQQLEQNLEGDANTIDKKVNYEKLNLDSGTVTKDNLQDAKKKVVNAAKDTLVDFYKKTGQENASKGFDAFSKNNQVRILHFLKNAEVLGQKAESTATAPKEKLDAYFKGFLDIFEEYDSINQAKEGLGALNKEPNITTIPSELSKYVVSGTPEGYTKTGKEINPMYIKIWDGANQYNVTCGRGFKDIKPFELNGKKGFIIVDGDGDTMPVLLNSKGKPEKADFISETKLQKNNTGDVIGNVGMGKNEVISKDGITSLSQAFKGLALIVGVAAALQSAFKNWNLTPEQKANIQSQAGSGAPRVSPDAQRQQTETLTEKGEKSQKAVSDAFDGLNFNSLEGRKTDLPTLASRLKSARDTLGNHLDQKAFDAQVLNLVAQNILGFSGKSLDAAKVKSIDYNSDTLKINFNSDKANSLELGNTINDLKEKIPGTAPETGSYLDVAASSFLGSLDVRNGEDITSINDIKTFLENNGFITAATAPVVAKTTQAASQEAAPEVAKAKIEESLFVLNENGKRGNVLIEQNGNTITYKQKGKLLGTLSIDPKTNKGILKVEDALKKIYPNVAAGEVSISKDLKATVENSRKFSEVLYRINEIDDQLNPRLNPSITAEEKTKLGQEKANLITKQKELTNAGLTFVKPPSAANFDFGPNIRQNIDAALAESEANQGQAPTQVVETQSFTPQLLSTEDAIKQLKSIKGGETLSLNLQHFKGKEANIFLDPNNVTALEQNAFEARIALFPESFDGESYAGVKKEVFLAKTSVLKDVIQKAKSITIHKDRILVDGKVFKIDVDSKFNKATNKFERTEQWIQKGTEEQLKPQAPAQQPAEANTVAAPAAQEQAAQAVEAGQTVERPAETVVQPLTITEASADITSLSSYRSLSRTMRGIWEGKGGLKSKGVDKLTVQVVSPTGEKLFSYDQGNVEQGVPQASSKKEIMAAMFLDKAEAERFEPSVEFALKDQTLYIKGKLAIIDVAQLAEVKKSLQGKNINKVVIDNSFMPDITNIPGLKGTDYDTTPFAMPFAIKNLSKNGNGDGVLPALKNPNTARDKLFTDLKVALGINSSAAMESGATIQGAENVSTLKQTWDPKEAVKYTLKSSNNYAANLLGFQAAADKGATSISKQDIANSVESYLKARGITRDIPDNQLFDLSGIASKTKDALMLTPAEMVQLTQYTHAKHKDVFPNYKNGRKIIDVQGKTGYVNDVASFRGTDKHGNVILIAMSDEEGRLGRDDKDHEKLQKARTRILESVLKQDLLLAPGTAQEKVEKQYAHQWEKAQKILTAIEWNPTNLKTIQGALNAINTGGLNVGRDTITVNNGNIEVRGSGLGTNEFIQISRVGDALSMQLVNTDTPDKSYNIAGLHKAYREQVNEVVKQESFGDTLAEINDTNKVVNSRLVTALKEIEKNQGNTENLKPLQQAVINILSQPNNISSVNLAGLAGNGAQLNNPNFIPKETQGAILNGLLKSQQISTESAINVTNFKVILRGSHSAIGFKINNQTLVFTSSGIKFGKERAIPYSDEKLFDKVKKVFPNARKTNQPMS